MRIIDFETKANELEIMDLIFDSKIKDQDDKQDLINLEEVMKKRLQ